MTTADLKVLLRYDRMVIILTGFLLATVLLPILLENNQRISINEAMINFTRGELLIAHSEQRVESSGGLRSFERNREQADMFFNIGARTLLTMRESFKSPCEIDSLVSFLRSNKHLPISAVDIRNNLYRSQKKYQLLRIGDLFSGLD